MSTIDNPKFKIKTPPENQFKELPLRADETTAKKFLEENELGELDNFESSKNKFSNDYGNLYNYYVSGDTYTNYWGITGYTYEWKTEFGYSPVITSISTEDEPI